MSILERCFHTGHQHWLVVDNSNDMVTWRCQMNVSCSLLRSQDTCIWIHPRRLDEGGGHFSQATLQVIGWTVCLSSSVRANSNQSDRLACMTWQLSSLLAVLARHSKTNWRYRVGCKDWLFNTPFKRKKKNNCRCLTEDERDERLMQVTGHFAC